MKRISLILLFLGVFLLPTASMSAITDDACSPETDTGITLDDQNTTYNVPFVPLTEGTSHLYYFYVATPGTVTITISNTANKVAINHSQNTCPAPGTETALNKIDPITITANESFDFNLILTAYGTNAGYTLDVTFTPAPLAITKTAYPVQVAVDTNTSVTYTIDVTNNTNASLGNIEFTDTLPAGVTLVSSIEDITPDGWDCSASSLPEISCETGSLTSKETVTFTLDTIINSSSDVLNTAEVQASTTEKVSSTSVVRAVSGTKPVDLEIQKYAEQNNIPPNTSFSYLFFVVNHSQSADAQLVTITDTFPSDYISIDGYDSSTGWTCTIPPPEGSNTFTCDFNRSLEHEITYFTVQATTGPIYQDHVINTVTVDALNPISGDHDINASADINITDANISGGALGGKYIQGGSIEVSDIAFSNRINAKLQTKVAATESMTIKTYFVDIATGAPSDYTPPSYDPTTNTQIVPVTVLLKLADDDCTVASETYLSYDGSPVAALFEADTDTDPDIRNAGIAPQANTPIETFTMRNIGQKKARIIMKYVDINEKLDYSGESCSVSSLSGSIKGLPQCIANSGGSTNFDNNKYINVFGIEAFIRCNIQNGQPCSSNNGGYGDDPYDNEYGCYECTVGSAGFCSNDNFSIRPKAFDVNISDGDFFRAGKDYSLAFKGLTANTTVTDETTLDYNETQNSTFAVDANVINNTNCQEKNISIVPNVQFQDGLDIGPFKFDDIGDINFSIHEREDNEFALVDENDTNDTQRLIEDFNVTFTVIPDHFEITATLTDHNDPNNLTYLHDINRYDSEDNYTMAANLTIDIEAMGEDNDTTSNYTEGCYAKDTNLTLGLNGTDIIYPGSGAALTHFLYYNPVEDDNSTDGGEGNYTLPAPVSTPQGNTISFNTLPIENLTSSFPEGAPDGNGTTHIEYQLNFDRKTHLVVNPVQMVLTDVNITEIDATIDPSNLVTGETGILTNQKATYYYARSRASKFFYEDITESNVDTPIIIDVYCDLSPTACSATGIDTVLGAINEQNWYVSLGHTPADGNITLMVGDPLIEGTGDPTINGFTNPNPKDVTNWTNGIDNTVNVDANNSVVPLTVPIELVRSSDTPTPTIYTNNWLIYNPNEPMPLSPFYKVRFIGDSSWTGEGQTGYIVDTNASLKKHKKMDW